MSLNYCHNTLKAIILAVIFAALVLFVHTLSYGDEVRQEEYNCKTYGAAVFPYCADLVVSK